MQRALHLEEHIAIMMEVHVPARLHPTAVQLLQRRFRRAGPLWHTAHFLCDTVVAHSANFADLAARVRTLRVCGLQMCASDVVNVSCGLVFGAA